MLWNYLKVKGFALSLDLGLDNFLELIILGKPKKKTSETPLVSF